MSSDSRVIPQPPFFIVAASRSGTATLRRMLNAHSCIAVPHEMKYFGESISHPLLEQWRDPGLERAEFEYKSERPPSGRTPSTGPSIEEAQVETWKHTLSAEEIALVETVCRAPMERLGYESVSDHLGMEARVMLALKSCYWMWKRHRSKEKRNFAMKYAPFARFRSQ